MTSEEDLKFNTPYRTAQRNFANDEDGLYEYLEKNRTEDLTLCLGYYLMRADRMLGMNQSDIASRTGAPGVEPVSRGFLSAMLSGRTKAAPETITRIARAAEANPLEFFTAMGLIDPSDIAAYQLPEARDWMPIAKKLINVPLAQRPRVVALVGAVIDTVLEPSKE